ncbi:GAF and ANTAR domain-containing protein [Micromonospora sp. LH3U1]|uniref:GAF and ANTAR domain-containing protein n=1 Tax=Micromonospora sp. LH3U1 TaxID=3018339 RepID=UPI00234ADA6D|nr:GAF and ANTAR domain-containing protein [Micromonospora sp. LH3U1]WCN79426.1 GAF and ANTAR domain-containing protein [Micromonospora sp. LH3U1]
MASARSMDSRAAVIKNLILRQSGEPGRSDGLLHRVCGAAAQKLAASGAGISVMAEDGVRGAVAASDSASERIEDLQFVFGEGPSIDAFASRRPVLVANLGDLVDSADGRWPFYAPAAHAGGLRAVFAFPLQIGAARLGVLDVFRDRAGPLTDTELADALAFADVTVTALLDRQAQRASGGIADIDDDGAEYRAELFQAQGMVMVQLGVTLGEAMARIRAYAYAENRRLNDVTRDIVARRLRFDLDER